MDKILTVWVLTSDDDREQEHEVSVHRDEKGAIYEVIDDLWFRYHFDTEEPYITTAELETKCREAESRLSEKGFWTDGDVTYTIEEKIVNEAKRK